MIPPVRLTGDVRELLVANMRKPAERLADLRAQERMHGWRRGGCASWRSGSAAPAAAGHGRAARATASGASAAAIGATCPTARARPAT